MVTIRLVKPSDGVAMSYSRNASEPRASTTLNCCVFTYATLSGKISCFHKEPLCLMQLARLARLQGEPAYTVEA